MKTTIKHTLFSRQGSYPLVLGALVLLAACGAALTTSPTTAKMWAKTYGGPAVKHAFSFRQTPDGGYVVVGRTASFGAGKSDAWVLKLDASGSVLWQKTYGGPAEDWAYSIEQTQEGGYIIAGITLSFGAGDADLWVVKLDASGNVVWQKTYGGSSKEYGYFVQQTADGGYLVVGETNSFGAGFSDIWVLKLDANGNISGCTPANLVQNSNATTANSTATPANSTAGALTSSATIADSTATITGSTATPNTQCTGP